MISPYIFAIGLISISWILIYWFKPVLRREMIVMSVLSALFFPVHNIYYLKDYWHPEYLFAFRLEDYLLMFVAAGIGVAIYPALLKTKQSAMKRQSKVIAGIIFCISVFGMIILTPFMNSVYAADLGFIIAIAIAWIYVPEIIKGSVITGVLFFFFVVPMYEIFYFVYPHIVVKWWQLSNLSGYFIFHFPIEEHIWDVLFAMALYSVYKIATGKKYECEGLKREG